MFPDKLTLWIVQACVVLAAVLGFYFWADGRGYDRAKAQQAKADDKAAVITRAKEEALLGVIWNVSYDTEETRIARERETAARVACLLAGTCRMQDRFSCPRVPRAAQAAAGSDDASTFGLQVEDGVFLVRESSRADGVADQLRQCQTVVNEYWRATQP